MNPPCEFQLRRLSTSEGLILQPTVGYHHHRKLRVTLVLWIDLAEVTNRNRRGLSIAGGGGGAREALFARELFVNEDHFEIAAFAQAVASQAALLRWPRWPRWLRWLRWPC